MTPERYKRVREIYVDALLVGLDRRDAYLTEVCGADWALRQDVELLLDREEQGGALNDQPTLEAATRVLTENQSESPIGQSIGNYRILSLLGRGGMGEVYLGEDARLRRKVAIKLLPAPFTKDRERLLRFEHEAQAASALNHPNIITIHEVGEVQTEAGSTHYLVTEYIEGETMRRRLKAGPMNLNNAHRRGIASCKRAPGSARERDHSPRHQAGECNGAARRAGQGAGFWLSQTGRATNING